MKEELEVPVSKGRRAGGSWAGRRKGRRRKEMREKLREEKESE